MPGTFPIRLGSALANAWTFESGSTLSTSDSGIQTCSIKALWPQGDSVFSNLPVAGISFSAVFGSSYLPSTFLVDYTDGGPVIEYLEGQIARATFQFKRIDPVSVNVRQVFVDSIINYKSTVPFVSQTLATGEPAEGIFGFPEPVCTVKYSSASQPSIGTGGLSSLYALPGSSNANGFPPVPDINVGYSFTAGAGTVVSFYDAVTMAFVSVTLSVTTTLNFSLIYKPNASGWQLTQLKVDPVAARNFWDVQETWRNFYFFIGVTLVSAVPPLPPP